MKEIENWFSLDQTIKDIALSPNFESDLILDEQKDNWCDVCGEETPTAIGDHCPKCNNIVLTEIEDTDDYIEQIRNEPI